MEKVLYISISDWFWIKQRPQHLCEGLSKLDYEVDYFGIRSWRKKNRIEKHSNNDNVNKSNIEINNNLKVFRKRVLPRGQYSPITYINGLYLRLVINRMFQKKHYDYVILTHPDQYLYLSENVKNKAKILYDCMDSYKDFWTKKSIINRINRLEKKVTGVADRIVASSSQIKNNLISNYEINTNKIKVINNGVDINNFDIERVKSRGINLLKKKVNTERNITYIGTIADWLDIDLIIKAANAFKNDMFYLIGPIETSVNRDLPKNIVFMGSKQYDMIPSYIYHSDILLMPFKLNDVVMSVNPVKLYEYLAMGKRVISIKYRETLKFSPYVYLYSSEKEFIDYLNKAETSRSDNDHDMFESRIGFAKENTWLKRAKSFSELLN